MAAGEQNAQTLGKGNLTLIDVVAQSVGFIGPVFSATFFIPTIAGASQTGKGAGIAAPVSIVIAAIGMLGVAWIVSRYAKRIHAAGSLYDYVTDGFGKAVGGVAGWIYYGGMLLLTLAIGLQLGGTIADTLKANHDINIPWWIISIAFWVIAFTLLYFGVEFSTRAQFALAMISLVVIAAFSIYVIAKGGHGGNSIKPFNPGESTGSGIFYGMLYAVIMFIGFETAANLAEETPNPARQIPRAVFASVAVCTVFYVVSAYAQVLGFGLDVGKYLQSFPGLFALAADPKFGSTSFSELVQWIVILDIAAVGLGTATGTSRGVFAMARDGRLPAPLGRVHPTHRTPVMAGAVLAIGSIIVVLLTHLSGGKLWGLVSLGDPKAPLPTYLPFFLWGATIGGFMLVIVYLLVSLTGFKGMPGESYAGLLVAGILGAAVSLGALWGVVYKAPDKYDRIWWLTLIWIAIGVVLTIVIPGRRTGQELTSDL